MRILRLHSLFNSNCASNCSTNHRVVAHADKAHHFNVGGHGGAACKLGVGMHTAHGVGHAVGSGTGGHIVRMQRTAGAAAGGHGEVLLALLDALFLVSAGDRVLEAGRVGGVAGDGHVHALMVHDSHTLANIIGACLLYTSPSPRDTR